MNNTNKNIKNCRNVLLFADLDLSLSVAKRDNLLPIVIMKATPTGKSASANQLLNERDKIMLTQNRNSNESTDPMRHQAVTNANPPHFGQLAGNALLALSFRHSRIVATSQCGQVSNKVNVLIKRRARGRSRGNAPTIFPAPALMICYATAN